LKKYKIQFGFNGLFPVTSIKEVEAIRETEKSIWLKDGRHPKKTWDVNYFDTKQDAKYALLDKFERILDDRRNKYFNTIDEFKKVRKL